jgi:hypothetical protein
MSKKKRKLRTDFRKNREVRARDKHIEHDSSDESRTVDAPKGERISGKGAISRKRTVANAEIIEDDAGTHVLPEIDRSICRLGRVLRVQGLVSIVRDDSGATFQCATRRLLKTLSTDQRHVVAAGDIVWFRPEGEHEGIIERVEPRHGVVSRTSRGRQHVLVANVDQLVIVTSAAEPRIKPNLIDRLLVTAERGGIRPVICINKIDLIEPADLMPLVGVYQRILRTCQRRKPERLDKPKSHQLSKSMCGEFWTTEAPAAKCLTNYAPPGESFVPPPGRNSGGFAPPPRANPRPHNDLRGRAGAKLAEFRPTRKKKKI